jgi:hypothetical protein
MASLHSCPRCGRQAEKSALTNYFDVHTCRECGEKYCSDCGHGNGTVCPECNSTSYSNYDKVYS